MLLVESLNLEIAPSEIVPTAPLYGEGLGLDSIDILEVALEVSRKYGFQLRSDDERNQQIFQSLRSLAAHVAQNRGDLPDASMSRWRMALLLLAGVAYAGVSHWMMLFHAAEPWAVGVLLGPLWLTALGLAGSRFGSWGLAVAGAGRRAGLCAGAARRGGRPQPALHAAARGHQRAAVRLVRRHAAAASGSR